MSASAPHLVAGGDDARARLDVVIVGDARAEARSLLDEDGVTTAGEDGHASRGHADAELLGLDFLGDADTHGAHYRTPPRWSQSALDGAQRDRARCAASSPP
jgi:hypothetical protein